VTHCSTPDLNLCRACNNCCDSDRLLVTDGYYKVTIVFLQAAADLVVTDSDPSNYRPILNLATLGKLLECVVVQQITSYLCQNNMFPEFQSAYRQYRSTETALIKVVNDIIRALDVGDVALLTLLDLSSAFDTVDHDILLTRLEISFSIESLPLKWKRSYLTSRTHTVSFGGRQSTSDIVHCGVPQGSVLGPLLFML
jgi:Reverse transcriptase (RNA-dependent DNA polymerase)